MATINIDHLATEIMGKLDVYMANTIEDVEHAIKVVARETAAELQETSPVGETGVYADSWGYKKSHDSGKDYLCMVVHSKNPSYRLTHLLEDGHDAVDGSWVNPRPHIAAAEEKAGLWMDDMLTKKLRG